MDKGSVKVRLDKSLKPRGRLRDRKSALRNSLKPCMCLREPRSPCEHRPPSIQLSTVGTFAHISSPRCSPRPIHRRICGNGGGAGWALRRDTKLASSVSGVRCAPHAPSGRCAPLQSRPRPRRARVQRYTGNRDRLLVR